MIGTLVQVVGSQFGNMSSDYLGYSIVALVFIMLFDYLESPALVDFALDQRKLGFFIPDRSGAYLGIRKQMKSLTWEDHQRLIIHSKRSFFGSLKLQLVVESGRGEDTQSKSLFASKWMGVGFYKLGELKRLLESGASENDAWLVRATQPS